MQDIISKNSDFINFFCDKINETIKIAYIKYKRKSRGKKMKAEIIAVGTEILLGQVVNTNATYLSQELATLGFEVYYHTVVGDNVERLEEILRDADNRSQLVVLCGGLGPTDDDLTKDVVATHVGKKLILDPTAMDKIEQYIRHAGMPMSENNRRQALTIEGSILVENPNGLAVGSLVQNQNQNYLLLPGPPGELRPMFYEKALPLLKKMLPQPDQLYSRVMRFYGIGESLLVTELDELIRTQTNPTVAPYAKTNEVTLRITAKAVNEDIANHMLDHIEEKIMEKVGTYFYGYGDNNSLGNVVVQLLIQNNKTITSAESLTAGLFQSMLGDISGVSKIFKGGFVTYSKEAKQKLLNISPEILKEHGVVSAACAKEMSEHARNILDTDYSLSFTGVAGPEELEGHESGTVWISLACKGSETQTKLYHFNRDRSYIRQSAVMAGLDMVRRSILKC